MLAMALFSNLNLVPSTGRLISHSGICGRVVCLWYPATEYQECYHDP